MADSFLMRTSDLVRAKGSEMKFNGSSITTQGDRCWELRRRGQALAAAYKVLQGIADEAKLDVIRKADGHALANTRVIEGEFFMFKKIDGVKQEQKLCESVEGHPSFTMKMCPAGLSAIGMTETPSAVKAKLEAAFLEGARAYRS